MGSRLLLSFRVPGEIIAIEGDMSMLPEGTNAAEHQSETIETQTFDYGASGRVSGAGLEEVLDLVRSVLLPIAAILGASDKKGLGWLEIAGYVWLAAGSLSFVIRSIRLAQDRARRKADRQRVTISSDGISFESLQSYKSANWSEVTGLEKVKAPRLIPEVPVWQVRFRQDAMEFSGSMPKHNELIGLIHGELVRRGIVQSEEDDEEA